MLQKQVFLMRVCGMTVTLFFLLTGCGEQKAKTTAKTDKSVVATVKSSKIQTKTVTALPNIAINPSFEEGKVFNSGLYEKGKSSTQKPVGWATSGQVLNDFTGWVSDEAHSGKRSLKIENVGGTNACWKGEPIIFKEPVNAFKASIWTKTKEIKDKTGKGKFQLVIDVYLKDDNDKEVKEKVIIDIAKTDHNWEKTREAFLYAMNIVKIVPSLYFSGTSGVIWFDDLDIIKREIIRGKNIIPNWNMEKESNGKVNNWKSNVLQNAEEGAVPALAWDSQGYKSNHSLKIANDDTTNNFWHQKINLKPNEVSRYYIFEGWSKANITTAKEPGSFYILFLNKDKSKIKASNPVLSRASHNWGKTTLLIELKEKPEKVNILCIFYGNGSVWFDNLSLTPIYFKDSAPVEK